MISHRSLSNRALPKWHRHTFLKRLAAKDLYQTLVFKLFPFSYTRNFSFLSPKKKCSGVENLIKKFIKDPRPYCFTKFKFSTQKGLWVNLYGKKIKTLYIHSPSVE